MSFSNDNTVNVDLDGVAGCKEDVKNKMEESVLSETTLDQGDDNRVHVFVRIKGNPTGSRDGESCVLSSEVSKTRKSKRHVPGSINTT